MDDLNEETTLESVLDSLRGRRLYSRRAQEKSCFRACDRFRHPLGYPRFEALVRRGEEPEGVFEEGFLKTLACYLPALEDPTKAKGMPEVSPNAAPMPSFAPTSRLGYVVAEALTWAKSNSRDSAAAVLLVNVCLSAIGVGPIYVRSNSRLDLEDPGSFLRALSATAHPLLSELERMKALRDGFDFDALAGVLRGFPIDSAIVFGSFAKGLQTEESDLDLAVRFEKGLSMGEKLAAIEGMKAAAGRFGLFCDVREFIRGDDAGLARRFHAFREVKVR